MPDLKPSTAPAAGALAGTDRLIGAQGSTDVHFLLSAITTYIVAQIVDSAPGTLDTLNELAAALGDDPNFATTMATALAGKQPLDSDLTAIAALTTTSFGRSLLEAANAAALRTLAGTVIGTDVQAYNAGLAAIAALTTTSYGRSVLEAANSGALRTLAGLVIGTDVQAYSANLATFAGINPGANVQSILAAANYAAIKTLLGLTVGTDVQAYDADLAALAGLVSAANQIPIFTGAGTAGLIDKTEFRYSAPMPSGQYLPPGGFGGTLTSPTAQGINTMKMFLGYIRRDITINALAVRIATVSAGGNIQAAIYAMDPTTGWPTGAPLVSSAALSTTTATGVADTTVNYTIPAGWYWFATNCDNATAACYSIPVNASAGEMTGSTSPSNAYASNGVSKSQTYGSWPTLTGVKATDGLSDNVTASMPIVFLRR